MVRSKQDWENAHMTLPEDPPMTTDNEAAAVEAACAAFYGLDWGTWTGYERRARVEAMRAAIAAHTAASAGEVDVGMAMHWIDRYASGFDEECQIDRVANALGVTLTDDYIVTPVPPPAAVPADALERLASRIVAYAGPQRNARLNGVPAEVLYAWANELAALIPKGADHGQR